MIKKANVNFAVCIISSDHNSFKEDNITAAGIICPEVILISKKKNDETGFRAGKMNVRLINGIDGDFPSELEKINFDWFLCLKSNERIKSKSSVAISSFLKNKDEHNYGIYVREYVEKYDYYNFSFIRNLQQYENLNEEAGVLTIEPRLVHKKNLPEVIRILTDEGNLLLPFSHTIPGLEIIPDAWSEQEPADKNVKDHDLLCFQGKIRHNILKEDRIDELNPGNIGFQVVNMGYMEGYLEVARRGWGSDMMYIHMFKFLIQNGYYEKAKAIFDLWINNKHGEENDLINSIGGCIYANLLHFDQAIGYYEKAVKYFPDAAFYETLGRLHLVSNHRDRSIYYYSKSLELSPNALTQEALDIIKNPDWRLLKLSACIIARDEEKTIAETIKSLGGIADEIIVVDTGSQDSTIEIARELGCKVSGIPWNDDFSAARNKAIEEATGDYILMIDADEYIDDRDKLGFLISKNMLSPYPDTVYGINFKDKETAQSFSVALLNSFLNKESSEYQIRIFPRIPEIRYYGFVFETLESTLPNIKFHTLPFLRITKQNTEMQKRQERKIKAVDKAAASLANTKAALDCAIFYLKSNEWEKALECLRRTKGIDPVLSANIVNYYTVNGKLEEAKIIAVNALNDNSDSLELNMALAGTYFREENYAAIYNTLNPFITNPANEISSTYKGDFFFYYGISALEKNNIDEAIDYLGRALETNVLDTRYQLAGLYAFAKSNNWEQFLTAAGEIVSQENIAVDFEISDFSDLGRLVFKFIQHYSRMNKNDESAILRKIIKHMIYSKFINIEEIDRLSKIINSSSKLQVSGAGQ